MALYEYFCKKCNVAFEIRLPMSEVTQLFPCPTCNERATKVLGNFSVGGRMEAGVGDGPAPWEGDTGTEADDSSTATQPPGMMGGGHSHPHGHTHGPGGGHSH